MAGLSKVIVLDRDVRAARQVVLGFVREGIDARVVDTIDGPVDAELVVVGGSPAEVTAARASLAQHGQDLPILFTGGGEPKAAVVAGATEALDGTARPIALRDIVTIGRLIGATSPGHRTHFVGQLAELTTALALIRALSAIGRSATLTLMRGLRRGEVRFFHGEVTSAELGLIHGQAALHQLLLWTDARFDFRREDVVRRQQIPLAQDDLMAEAEQFLAGIRESSGVLSPATVLEQDVQRVHGLGKQIPTEVHGVLRMFDGHRVLADVLEDSPYRVFETLRVTQRALEAGLLRITEGQRPKATWRAMLALDEWLVGKRGDGVVATAAAELDSEPVATDASLKDTIKQTPSAKADKKKRKNRKQRRANTPLPVPTAAAKPGTPGHAPSTIDWGALVPRAIGADPGVLSPVVPAAKASGEISLPPSREVPREKLEALMDTGKRERVFSGTHLEPKVVFDDSSTRAPTPPAFPAVAEPGVSEADARRALEAKHVSSAGREVLEKAVRARRASEELKVVIDGGAGEATPSEAELRQQEIAAAAEKIKAEARERAAAEAKAQAEAEQAKAEEEARVAAEAKAKAEADAAEAAKAKALADAIKGGASKAREDAEARVLADARAAMAIGDTVTTDARPSQPTIAVDAIAADAAAVAAIATAEPKAEPRARSKTAPPNLAGTPHDQTADHLKHDAAAFSDSEEAFFRAHDDKHGAHPHHPNAPAIQAETFDDLDEGYQRVGFWDRLIGRKPKKRDS